MNTLLYCHYVIPYIWAFDWHIYSRPYHFLKVTLNVVHSSIANISYRATDIVNTLLYCHHVIPYLWAFDWYIYSRPYHFLKVALNVVHSSIANISQTVTDREAVTICHKYSFKHFLSNGLICRPSTSVRAAVLGRFASTRAAELFLFRNVDAAAAEAG